MNIAAADLNRSHLGQTIRVTQGESEFRDVLRGISHQADVIRGRVFMEEVPHYMLGKSETTISLLHAGDIQVSGSDIIEFIGVEVA